MALACYLLSLNLEIYICGEKGYYTRLGNEHSLN